MRIHVVSLAFLCILSTVTSPVTPANAKRVPRNRSRSQGRQTPIKRSISDTNTIIDLGEQDIEKLDLTKLYTRDPSKDDPNYPVVLKFTAPSSTFLLHPNYVTKIISQQLGEGYEHEFTGIVHPNKSESTNVSLSGKILTSTRTEKKSTDDEKFIRRRNPLPTISATVSTSDESISSPSSTYSSVRGLTGIGPTRDGFTSPRPRHLTDYDHDRSTPTSYSYSSPSPGHNFVTVTPQAQFESKVNPGSKSGGYEEKQYNAPAPVSWIEFNRTPLKAPKSKDFKLQLPSSGSDSDGGYSSVGNSGKHESGITGGYPIGPENYSGSKTGFSGPDPDYIPHSDYGVPNSGHDVSSNSYGPPSGHDVTNSNYGAPIGHEVTTNNYGPLAGHEVTTNNYGPPAGHGVTNNNYGAPIGHDVANNNYDDSGNIYGPPWDEKKENSNTNYGNSGGNYENDNEEYWPEFTSSFPSQSQSSGQWNNDRPSQAYGSSQQQNSFNHVSTSYGVGTENAGGYRDRKNRNHILTSYGVGTEHAGGYRDRENRNQISTSYGVGIENAGGYRDRENRNQISTFYGAPTAPPLSYSSQNFGRNSLKYGDRVTGSTTSGYSSGGDSNPKVEVHYNVVLPNSRGVTWTTAIGPSPSPSASAPSPPSPTPTGYSTATPTPTPTSNQILIGFSSPTPTGFSTPGPISSGFSTPSPISSGFSTPSPTSSGFSTPNPVEVIARSTARPTGQSSTFAPAPTPTQTAFSTARPGLRLLNGTSTPGVNDLGPTVSGYRGSSTTATTTSPGNFPTTQSQSQSEFWRGTVGNSNNPASGSGRGQTQYIMYSDGSMDQGGNSDGWRNTGNSNSNSAGDGWRNIGNSNSAADGWQNTGNSNSAGDGWRNNAGNSNSNSAGDGWRNNVGNSNSNSGGDGWTYSSLSGGGMTGGQSGSGWSTSTSSEETGWTTYTTTQRPMTMIVYKRRPTFVDKMKWHFKRLANFIKNGQVQIKITDKRAMGSSMGWQK